MKERSSACGGLWKSIYKWFFVSEHTAYMASKNSIILLGKDIYCNLFWLKPVSTKIAT